VEIHELLVLKEDGGVEHFHVSDGDVAQARLRASLCQRPGDSLVVVTEHAYIRSGSNERAETFPGLAASRAADDAHGGPRGQAHA
jgi:hypothetical protein